MILAAVTAMKIVPLNQFKDLSFESFQGFLAQCKVRAEELKHPQLVSISLRVRHVDPLAVLESIYDEKERHFYIEHPSKGEAIAGAESVLEFHATGKNRFMEIRDFACETLENCIVAGESSLPFFGPHFFASFSFETDLKSGHSGSVFIPRWQVGIARNISVAVANLLVEEHSNLDLLAKKVWGAHEKFSHFDYTEKNSEKADDPDKKQTLSIEEFGGESVYRERVKRAVASIKEGKYRKIVLARRIDVVGDKLFHPFHLLSELRQNYPDCYAFSLGLGNGSSFIGASPERLVKIESGQLQTVALAGSIRRGKTASEDASFASQLLNSEKDIGEHRFVSDCIRSELESIGLNTQIPDQVGILRLANVQHLILPIEAKVENNIHILDATSVLHPTPAVGGFPKERIQADIAFLEGFERGLYSGTIGWFNAKGEGEMIVGLRSAFVSENKGCLFSGAGIVADSDPEREDEETWLKLKAILGVLEH